MVFVWNLGLPKLMQQTQCDVFRNQKRHSYDYNILKVPPPFFLFFWSQRKDHIQCGVPAHTILGVTMASSDFNQDVVHSKRVRVIESGNSKSLASSSSSCSSSFHAEVTRLCRFGWTHTDDLLLLYYLARGNCACFIWHYSITSSGSTSVNVRSVMYSCAQLVRAAGPSNLGGVTTYARNSRAIVWRRSNTDSLQLFRDHACAVHGWQCKKL